MSGKNYRVTRVYDVNIQPDNWEDTVRARLIAILDDERVGVILEEGAEFATYGYDGGDVYGEMTLTCNAAHEFVWVDPSDVSERDGDTVMCGPFRYGVEMTDESEVIDI